MAVLAAAVSLTVLVPLYRSGAGRAAWPTRKSSVYRDQLGELDRDLERGVIAPARGRGGADRDRPAADPRRRRPRAPGRRRGGETPRRIAAAAAVVAMPLLALGLYVSLGSPGLPDAPLAARLSAPPEQQDMAVLMARVEQHLAANPDDLQGWRVIAPVYVRLGRLRRCHRGLRQHRPARRQQRRRPRATSARRSCGPTTVPSPPRRARHSNARRRTTPRTSAARFYLALGRCTGRPDRRGRDRHPGLIAEAPPGATWVGGMRQLLAELEGARPGRPRQPGPTAADVEAAGAMSGEDRTAMIEGMVAQLADRLAGRARGRRGLGTAGTVLYGSRPAGRRPRRARRGADGARRRERQAGAGRERSARDGTDPMTMARRREGHDAEAAAADADRPRRRRAGALRRGLCSTRMTDRIVFFTAPSDFAANPPPPGTRLRIGGLVEEGSVVKGDDGAVTFSVTDGGATVPVAYKGILPDLFREGQGVVAEGLVGADGVFTADFGARQARREIHAARGRRRAQGARASGRKATRRQAGGPAARRARPRSRR